MSCTEWRLGGFLGQRGLSALHEGSHLAAQGSITPERHREAATAALEAGGIDLTAARPLVSGPGLVRAALAQRDFATHLATVDDRRWCVEPRAACPPS